MKNVNLTVPLNYSEMTEKQIRYVADLQVYGQKDTEIWQKCFIAFAQIKPVCSVSDSYFFSMKKSKQMFSLKVSELNYFAKKMSWLTKSYIGFKPFDLGKHKPCDSLLRDTNFIQYLDAENYYQQFIFTKNEQALYNMMGTLYQIGKKYSKRSTVKRAKYFALKCTESDKLIAIMWMMAIKEYFKKKFKYLFVTAKSEDDDDGTPPDMFEIMKNQIRMLTGGNIKDEPAILKSPTWSALYELDKKCMEADQLQKTN